MIPALSMLTMLGGEALQAVGALDEADAARQAAEFNAGQADIMATNADFNAKLEREMGDEKERQVVEYGVQLEGSIRAAYGASGVRMDGTPSEYLERQKAIVEQNRVMTRYQTFLQSEKFKQEAKRYRAQADAYRRTASSAASAGTLGALSAGVGGMTNILKRTT